MSTEDKDSTKCSAEALLKLISGKWKPQIFLYATLGSIRFSSLMRQLEGVNKQSLTTALREMENEGLLLRKVIREKPLHVEYELSEKGTTLIPIFRQIESLIK